MSNHAPEKSSMENLVDSYLHELIQMPDDYLLEGIDRKKTASFGIGMLQRARAEAGRRRLIIAKAGVKSVTEQASMSSRVVISISEAQAYIRKASNSSLFTLAARELDEMSDNDIMRLYQQIRELEAIAHKGSKS